MNFILDVFPWGVIGITVIVAGSVYVKALKKKLGKITKPVEVMEDTYMTMGMSLGLCFGMCIGVVIGTLLGGNALTYGICFGPSFGMMIGMSIGLCINKK